MKIYDVQQGSSQWLALRAGIPTASNFEKIVTPGGKPSQSAEPYMFRLLAERIMGHPVAETASGWMDRGNAVEPDAVARYEFQHDVDTVSVGFMTNDRGTVGASPDRLVGDQGLLEIKSPSESIQMSYLLKSGRAYGEYKVQVQGQLWIAERDWTDLMAFHPELPDAEIRIERDEKFIQTLETEVTSFVAKLEEMAAECERRGYMQADSPHPPVDIMQAMRDSLASLKQ